MGVEFLKMLVGAPEQNSSCPFSKVWPCPAISECFFYSVNFADLKEDPGGDFCMVALGFGELPPDMGEAADGGKVQVVVPFEEGPVGAEAVALEVAAEGVLGVFTDEN